MPTLSNGFVSFLKGLGFVLLTALLTFLGDQTHLSFLAPQYALIVSGVAVYIESYVEGRTGKSLFGAAVKQA